MALCLWGLISLVAALPGRYDWGTYNPGAYIGLRSRMLNFPSSGLDTINAGVMWGNSHELRSAVQDPALAFTYHYNDPGNFAEQHIADIHNACNLTSVLQVDQDSGNAWQLTLTGRHAPKTKYAIKKPFISVIFHISLIGKGIEYSFSQANGVWSAKNDHNETLFTLEVDQDKSQEYHKDPLNYYCKEVNDSRAFAWNALDYAKSLILTDKVMAKDPNAFGHLPDVFAGKRCNLLLLQTVVKLDFEIKYKFNQPKLSDLEELKRKFDTDLEAKFGTIAAENLPFARSVLSNLLGGIGYFTGPIRIAGKGKSNFGKLFSCTPSRVTFPRGFLWDEGFHLQIVCRWSQGLCIEILKSWLDTQDEQGWIPREQIRGEEAEGRVPAAFLQQNDTIANPPTLLFPVVHLLDSIATIPEESLATHPTYLALQYLYPKLVKWLRWMYKTQMRGNVPMWRGRSSDHNLASGLDDYPRAQQTNHEERHLDLHCWLLFFTSTLNRLAERQGLREDTEMFRVDNVRMLAYMKPFFFDKSTNLYSDFIGRQWFPKGSLQLRYSWRGDNQCGQANPLPSGEPSECNPYSDSPCCSEFGWCGNSPSHCNCPKCHISLPLNKRPDYESNIFFSPHIGYVTLFPLIHGVLESEDPAFEKLLATMRDENELWTKFGLRSLSKSSKLYRTGENYWRGHIWLNINYMVLQGIRKHYWSHPAAQALYIELRNNLVQTVKFEWESTGSLYEQYSEDNGRGRRSRAFYGWSALTLLAMQEIY